MGTLKIISCTDKNYWYYNSVGQEIQFEGIEENGDAFISEEIVEEICPSGEVEDTTIGGIISNGDFKVISE